MRTGRRVGEIDDDVGRRGRGRRAASQVTSKSRTTSHSSRFEGQVSDAQRGVDGGTLAEVDAELRIPVFAQRLQALDGEVQRGRVQATDLLHVVHQRGRLEAGVQIDLVRSGTWNFRS